MDFLMPVSFGVVINIVVYGISIGIFKKEKTASLILYLTTAIMIITSLYVGSWTGMGMGVIALGMLITAVFFTIRNVVRSRRLTEKPI